MCVPKNSFDRYIIFTKLVKVDLLFTVVCRTKIGKILAENFVFYPKLLHPVRPDPGGCVALIAIIPQASRLPALPVFLLSSSCPLPRSSDFS